MITEGTVVIDMSEPQPAPAGGAGGFSNGNGQQPAPGTGSVVLEEEASVVVVDERAALGEPLPAAAVLNDDGSITLVLRKPVTVLRKTASGERSELIEQMTFHRLTGADMRAVAAVTDINAQIVLMARSARMREAVMGKIFDAMDAADVVDAGLCVERFFGTGRKTGR